MALLFDIKSFFLNLLARLSGALIILMLMGVNAHAATILILGDSLSASYGVEEQAGWVNLLRQKMPKHNIINGSISGETTGGGLRRLPALLDSHAPELVVIELGGNDGLRGFPPTQLKNNLTKMIQLSKNAGAKVLLTQIMVPPNYGPRYTKLFNQTYSELAKEHAVILAPFFMTEIAIKPELMQRDGLHPNKQAQPLITELMQPWIAQALTQAPNTKATVNSAQK